MPCIPGTRVELVCALAAMHSNSAHVNLSARIVFSFNVEAEIGAILRCSDSHGETIVVDSSSAVNLHW